MSYKSMQALRLLQEECDNKQKTPVSRKSGIIAGDCLEVMTDLPDSSVDLVITYFPNWYLWTKKIANLLAKKVRKSGAVYIVAEDGICIGMCPMMYPERVIRDFHDEGMSLHKITATEACPSSTPVNAILVYFMKFLNIPLTGDQEVDPGVDMVYSQNRIMLTNGALNKMFYIRIIEKNMYASVVLDPFAGNGSVVSACQEMRKKYIAIESDPKKIERLRKDEGIVI